MGTPMAYASPSSPSTTNLFQLASIVVLPEETPMGRTYTSSNAPLRIEDFSTQHPAPQPIQSLFHFHNAHGFLRGFSM